MSVYEDGVDSFQLYEFLRHKQTTDAELLELVQMAERVVRQYVPNARLLLTTDKRGRVASAGVYDAPLLLNHLGQFRPLQQYAPQKLSKQVECKDNYHATLRLKMEFDLWTDALLFVARKTPELSKQLQSQSATGTLLP